MSEVIIKKNGTDYPLLTMPNHYPADRVYLDGDTTKTVQDKCARKADLTNLDLTGTTNTTGSTIASGTYFYLDGVLVRAKTNIASGATFTLNTNYEVVPISKTLKEINDAIDELTDNTISGYTDISGYTTSDNKFIAPANGYVNIVVKEGQNGYASIRGSNDTVDVSIGKIQGDHAVYVRKGMKVQIVGTLTGAYFVQF